MSRARTYCYTLNNYTLGECDNLEKIPCYYNVYGREVGKEGTPHLQGFIMFKDAKSFLAVKKLLGDKYHIEKCKGSPISNYQYCTKDGNFVEINPENRPKGSGKRTDLDNVADAIKAGAKKKDICENYGSQFIKYHRGIEAMINEYQEHRSGAPTVIWYYGETGCGKTRLAVKTGNLHGSYFIKDNTKWWNGYDQQKVIIIDDFDAEENEMGFRNLLRLLDRYQFTGETKGGYVKINSGVIIITSDRNPELMYDKKKFDQLRRRINCLSEVKNGRLKNDDRVISDDLLSDI